ncbi:GNAT family N-acetyltransferase [Chitinimonas sp. BJB300]|uniref:GNAT family N-acetyltransferase n=1 Tax=Chitinimonas sp. BJB300 TaxID=1559339 RepID=UPI000C0E7D46|nr:GNAT family N-acetyltransferase [Chitinimonas sp. BJB300]PHV12946.1 GNAT family N-acetyltransferase [Chitinimonas sp. BJB300]TSJ89101.1 GNAT family N-acetyltransferase [Chitinimonas sp. BJB300]
MQTTLLSNDDFELRRLRASDAAALFNAIDASRPEISQWQSWCGPDYQLEHTAQYVSASEVNWDAGTEYAFVAQCKQSRQILAMVTINHIRRDHQFGNLGYWTRSSHAGRGIASQIALAAARFALQVLGLVRVEIIAEVKHQASQQVARNIGAVEECIARNRLLYRGEPRDALLFSFIASDLM